MLIDTKEPKKATVFLMTPHEMKKRSVDDIWKRYVKTNEGEDITTEMILKHLRSRGGQIRNLLASSPGK